MSDIILTPSRPFINNLDDLPIPDRSNIDYEKYSNFIGDGMFKNVISIQASRGCPFRCKYCHKIWPKKHFVRSAENIFGEVRLYYDMGIKRFSFVDDIFNLDVENSSRFFQLIIDHRLDVNLAFPNGLRGDILTKDYIDLMFQAGTVNVSLALETASPRLQKLIGKNLNLEKFRENIDYICTKYPNVILSLETMLGFPSETEEEALMTLDFIKKTRWIAFPYINILKIFPNTDMAELAVENGISPEAIRKSEDLSYIKLPETLPFKKEFALWYQTSFLHDYFLLKERILHLLPYQLKILSKEEIIKKYSIYLPQKIDSLNDLLQIVGISKDELKVTHFIPGKYGQVPDLNIKLRKAFPQDNPAKDALRVLLLDLSQFLSGVDDRVNQLVEAPLGLMYLITYLKQQYGKKIAGKIAKSFVDFDSFDELRLLIDGFQPDLIGIRCLTINQRFFHQTVEMIRNWGIAVPIIAGGPYATSSYDTLLQDSNIDAAVIGEGEITFAKLVEKIMENGGELPEERILKGIQGIAFIIKNVSEGAIASPGIQQAETEELYERERENIISQFNENLEND